MSNVFTYREIAEINDCRKLNYLECIGLISHAIMFDKIISIREDELNLFKYIINGNTTGYIHHCNPEYKTTELTIKNKFATYEVYFCPKGENGIRINICTSEGYRIGNVDYNIDEMLDMLI